MCQMMTGKRRASDGILEAWKVLSPDGESYYYPEISIEERVRMKFGSDLGRLERKWRAGRVITAHELDFSPTPFLEHDTGVHVTRGGIHVFFNMEAAYEWMDDHVPSGRIAPVLVWGDFLPYENGGAFEFATIAEMGDGGGEIDVPAFIGGDVPTSAPLNKSGGV